MAPGLGRRQRGTRHPAGRQDAPPSDAYESRRLIVATSRELESRQERNCAIIAAAVIRTDLRKVVWMIPAEILEVGFSCSRVVMVNEAHNGLLRCVRTREVGGQLLVVAQRLGVRHLAMEALGPPRFDWTSRRGGYLVQPEMEALLHSARDLGIELLVDAESVSAAWPDAIRDSPS